MPHGSEDSSQYQRLEQALNKWLDFVDRGEATDAETFLRDVDPEIRPLLEPMLQARPEDDAAPDHAPRKIGTFRILGELGRGGMGIVYEAEDEALERRVALKVLGPHFASSPASRERFRREGAAAAKLKHPGIVEVYGIGEDDGHHWIAMELVDGESLAEKLRGGGSLGVLESGGRTAEVAEVAAQIAEALAFAHEQNIVHRDIKPHNVLIGGDGRVRIVDFGLAKHLDRDSLSMTGDFAGSLAYASPEQVSGSRDLDARSDIWSLGVVLYEALSGDRPFEAETPTAVMRNIHTREPRAPGGPGDLEVICLKALQKEPQHRFASASQMAADLRRFLDHEPIHAVLPGTVSRLVRYVRRRRGVTVAVAVILGLTILAGVLWFQKEERDEVVSGMVESAQRSLVRLQELVMAHGDSAMAADVRKRPGQIKTMIDEADRLLAIRPDHLPLVRTVACVHEHAGRLYQLYKMQAEALASHLRAVELMSPILEADPDDHEARHARGVSLHNLHVFHRAMGKDEIADVELARSIQDSEHILKHATDAKTRRIENIQLAAALTNRARPVVGTTKAKLDLERAIELWESEVKPTGMNAREVARYLDAKATLAEHLLRISRLPDAIRELDEVIEQIEAMGSDAVRISLVGLHVSARLQRSKGARMTGQHDLARADLDKALGLAEGVAAGGAADLVLQAVRARSELVAYLIDRETDLQTARKLLDRARRALRGLASDAAGLVVVRYTKAQIASLEAHLLVAERAPADRVEPAMRRALAARREFRESHPGPERDTDLAQMEGSFGTWLRRQNRLSDAHAELTRALDRTATVLRQRPSNPTLQRNLRVQSRDLFYCIDKLAKSGEFAPIAKRIVEAAPRDPAILRMALRALDYAMARKRGDKAERNAFGEKMVQRAVEWIERADKTGVVWRQKRFAGSLHVLPLHPKTRALLTSKKKR